MTFFPNKLSYKDLVTEIIRLRSLFLALDCPRLQLCFSFSNLVGLDKRVFSYKKKVKLDFYCRVLLPLRA